MVEVVDADLGEEAESDEKGCSDEEESKWCCLKTQKRSAMKKVASSIRAHPVKPTGTRVFVVEVRPVVLNDFPTLRNANYQTQKMQRSAYEYGTRLRFRHRHVMREHGDFIHNIPW